MHFAAMVHHATAKVRPRSMQFDRSPIAPEPKGRRAASRDTPTHAPAPGTRTSSLPLTNSRQQYTETPIRHYRSMLNVEPVPKLPLAKPLSYGELYQNDLEPVVARKAPLRRPLDSHAANGIPTNFPSPTMAGAVPHLKPSSSGSEVSPQAPSDLMPVAPSALSDNRNIVRRKLTGYVGFANLPNQWHRKSVRKGFNFNVMVVGESGLGKSTLVNTLFNTSLYPPKEAKEPSLDIIPKTVTIQSISADIEEAGVRLRLTVVDTPGFGDFVNNDESWRPIIDNIEQRFDAYLDAENKVNRMNIVDNRIHACVFFIQPTGHSLKPLDIEVMKRLHTKVNLIPVIAKADTLTDEEVAAFKARILADIKYHKVQIFEGPRYELDDEETIAENNEIMSKVPFAVVGANNEVTNADGHKVRGRSYPWGVIEVDNEEHCDFVKLRQMLIRTHMEELKEHTNNNLYENYRTDKLIAMGVSQDPSVFKEVNPAVKQEEERTLHEQKLAKMEAEMKMVFQQKVSEKESKLKQSEEELYARHREMKEQLERQRLELEEKKSRIESGRPLEKEPKRKGFSLR
ncbi:Septin-domain-containing protein [Chaetomidium leptoderma]|uniref:Septin-domain-containing protein n=1 Tax=Chaetomidium leptoderma TaxID=669021 RepID=A0AAN6ZXN6_9PEZI|nr:Septin-domain-containing protein [Chaetomidium leptoderma]